jgi:hypothetical protein
VVPTPVLAQESDEPLLPLWILDLGGLACGYLDWVLAAPWVLILWTFLAGATSQWGPTGSNVASLVALSIVVWRWAVRQATLVLVGMTSIVSITFGCFYALGWYFYLWLPLACIFGLLAFMFYP